MKATTAVAQTLTCNIGDITRTVEVSWKDEGGDPIVDGQGGYTITNGQVNGSNTQVATLTIDSVTLRNLDTSSAVTYTCSARSSQYPESKQSTDQNVVITLLTFG